MKKSLTFRTVWPLLVAVALGFALTALASSYPDIQACAGQEGAAKGGCCNEQRIKCVKTCNGNGSGCGGYCSQLFQQCMGTGAQ